MVFANDFQGMNDSEIINRAVENRDSDGIVVISHKKGGSREFWLLDSAILLPENTTVILQNVKLKLSDNCRDNFFRTANCGIGIEDPKPIENVHIKGEGLCLLEGADHPRATGDGSKLLRWPCPHWPEDIIKVADWIPESHRESAEKVTFADIHSYTAGTDAGKEGQSQYGDWRNIGILFANLKNFSISGIKISQAHAWAISLEACSYGRVEKIEFEARMHREIDGMDMNIENQDGVDIRNGCHHIVISDITGCTGDDVIALTAIAKGGEYRPGGSFKSTHVMHNDWSKREKDIHDIEIRSVTAHSYLCWVVRLLPGLTYIYNVVIDGVIDDAPEIKKRGGTLNLGDGGTYAENLPDSMRNITISNVVCNSCFAVAIRGYLTDSVITNVINKNPDCEAITVTRENGTKNVAITGVITAK